MHQQGHTGTTENQGLQWLKFDSSVQYRCVSSGKHIAMLHAAASSTP